MKQLLFLGLLTFHFSAFAQIDSIKYEAKTIWSKTYVFANCGPSIEDCLVWRLVEKIDVQNPINGEIEEYIFINEGSQTFIDSLPYLYQKDSLDSYENRPIFVDLIRNQHPELETILNKKYGDSNTIYFMGEFDIHGEELSKDWIFVLSQGMKQFLIIDLKTNRVIEKIKIE